MSSDFKCSYMARSSLAYIPNFSVKFSFQLIYTDYANWAYFDKKSHLNLLLWNRWTKLKQIWQGWSLGGSLSILCPTAPPPFKMAAVTKNRNFFSCQFPLYFKSKWTQILTAMSSLTYILGFSGRFFQPVYSV